MTDIPERQILEILSYEGRTLADWFLVRWQDSDNFLPLAWSPLHGPLACVIEEANEANAFVEYLRRSGARQFGDRSDLLAAAKQEEWPGWENHCA